MSAPPFWITEQGWGEFPLHIEVVPKKGTPVKITHYLKLNAPDSIVVNETFEYIQPKIAYHPDMITDLTSMGSGTPVMSEYFESHAPIDYVALENNFIDANEHLMRTLRGSILELGRQVLTKSEDVLRLQSKLD